MKPSRAWPAAALAMVLIAAPWASQAAITVHTSQGSFLSAIGAPGTDTFDEQPADGPVFPYIGLAGSYVYSADAAFDGIFFLAPSPDHWLSTTSPGEFVTIYDLPAEVRGIGGNFFSTNFDSGVQAGFAIQFEAQDATSSTSFTLASSDQNAFVGFVSSAPWTTLVVRVLAPAGVDAFTTVNNLTLGAAAVPEPGSYLLMAAGLGLLGVALRRRAA